MVTHRLPNPRWQFVKKIVIDLGVVGEGILDT